MSNLYIGDKLNTYAPNTQVSLKALATPTKLSINMAIGIKSLKKEKKTLASPATSFTSYKIGWDAMKGLTGTNIKASLAQKNKEYQDATKATNKGTQIMAKSPAKKQVKRPTSKDLPGNGMVKNAGRAIEERKKKMRQLGV